MLITTLEPPFPTTEFCVVRGSLSMNSALSVSTLKGQAPPLLCTPQLPEHPSAHFCLSLGVENSKTAFLTQASSSLPRLGSLSTGHLPLGNGGPQIPQELDRSEVPLPVHCYAGFLARIPTFMQEALASLRTHLIASNPSLALLTLLSIKW